MVQPSEPPLRGYLLPPAVTSALPVPLAARVMRRLGLDSLVVLDKGRVYGVLTERDLLRTATLRGRRAARANVADVCCRELDLMTPEPLLVHPAATVAEVAPLMVEAGVGAAVAMGEVGVTGVVTGRDIAAAGKGDDPHDVTVKDVYVEMIPLSVHDDIERTVDALAANHGGPVPVVEDGLPVGAVQVTMSPTSGRLSPGGRLDPPVVH